MDAHPPSRAVSLVDVGSLGATAGRWLVISVQILLAVLGAVICARRLAGSLETPLPASALLVAGAVFAAWSTAVRSTLGRPTHKWLQAVPTAAAALVALAVSIPGTSLAGLAALWLTLIGAEVLSRLPLSQYLKLKRFEFPQRPVARPVLQQPVVPDEPEPIAILPGLLDDVADGEDELGEDVSQRLVRRRADGEDVLEGFVRVPFAPAERTAHGHVAFCPPFATQPVCDAEQADGPAARIRIGQLFAHGVRFDVKLDDPADDATSVLVEFSARSSDELPQSKI